MIDRERVDCLREEIGQQNVKELVRLFMNEVAEVVGRLKRLGSPGERETDLQFLKGSALNLGFSDLAALCQTGERRAAGGATVETGPVIKLYSASRRAFLHRPGRLPREAA